MDLICLRAEKPAYKILLICEFMLKSLSMKTPRLLTLFEGDMKVSSILICLVGNLFTFVKEKNHIASVLDLLSLRLLDSIQAAISSTQSDNLFCNCSVSPGKQLEYNCVSSAYWWKLRLCLCAIVSRSLEYRLNKSGPITEPCGTPVWRWNKLVLTLLLVI